MFHDPAIGPLLRDHPHDHLMDLRRAHAVERDCFLRGHEGLHVGRQQIEIGPGRPVLPLHPPVIAQDVDGCVHPRRAVVRRCTPSDRVAKPSGLIGPTHAQR